MMLITVEQPICKTIRVDELFQNRLCSISEELVIFVIVLSFTHETTPHARRKVNFVPRRVLLSFNFNPHSEESDARTVDQGILSSPQISKHADYWDC